MFWFAHVRLLWFRIKMCSKCDLFFFLFLNQHRILTAMSFVNNIKPIDHKTMIQTNEWTIKKKCVEKYTVYDVLIATILREKKSSRMTLGLRMSQPKRNEWIFSSMSLELLCGKKKRYIQFALTCIKQFKTV